MADLKAALDRLARAVERLEHAATHRGPIPEGEQQHLAAELARTRAEFNQLHLLTDDVSRRLDGAIDTLRHTLEE